MKHRVGPYQSSGMYIPIDRPTVKTCAGSGTGHAESPTPNGVGSQNIDMNRRTPRLHTKSTIDGHSAGHAEQDEREDAITAGEREQLVSRAPWRPGGSAVKQDLPGLLSRTARDTPSRVPLDRRAAMAHTYMDYVLLPTRP